MTGIIGLQIRKNVFIASFGLFGLFPGNETVNNIPVFALQPEEYPQVFFQCFRRVDFGGKFDEGIVITDPDLPIAITGIKSGFYNFQGFAFCEGKVFVVF